MLQSHSKSQSPRPAITRRIHLTLNSSATWIRTNHWGAGSEATVTRADGVDLKTGLLAGANLAELIGKGSSMATGARILDA